MRTLTQPELDAIDTFRNLFPVKRAKKLGCRDWKECLQDAWMQDWPEQRGTLRQLRNDVSFGGTSKILQQYVKQQG